MSFELSPRQSAKYVQLCPKALLHFYQATEDVEDFVRASGLADCPECGNPFFDHPHHPFSPDLTIACNGELLKL